MRFEAFAAIDWSGAKGGGRGGIAVALCEPGDAAPRLLRHEGGWTREAVLRWLLEQGARGRDLIVGFDFSMSFPFADRGAFFPGWDRSPADARELWALVDAICEGDAELAAGSFVDHAQSSRHFRRHGGRCGDLFGAGGGRLRMTEQVCRADGHGPAQSSFNLVGAAQVGKSSLTGMRMLHRLGRSIPVWPFDERPAEGPVLVELYTTIAARAAGVAGRSKIRDGGALDAALAALGSGPHAVLPRYDDHSTDALIAAAWLRRFADDGRLWSPAGLSPSLARTEGWTFGVP